MKIFEESWVGRVLSACAGLMLFGICVGIEIDRHHAASDEYAQSQLRDNIGLMLCTTSQSNEPALVLEIRSSHTDPYLVELTRTPTGWCGKVPAIKLPINHWAQFLMHTPNSTKLRIARLSEPTSTLVELPFTKNTTSRVYLTDSLETLPQLAAF